MPKDAFGNNIESAADINDNPVCIIDPSMLHGYGSSPQQLCVKGMEEYDNGQLMRAMQYYLTALSLKPDFIPALLGTSCILVAMERYQEAQAYLDYVFELDPDIKDAKLLRNMINNAKTGYPVFHDENQVKESEPPDKQYPVEDDIAEEELPPPPSSSVWQGLKPYIIGLAVISFCYWLALPLLDHKEASTPVPAIASIRQSLSSEPVLKNKSITAVLKGDTVAISGMVSNQAEQRLAVVIAEQAAMPLKVDAAQLKIGESTSPVNNAVENSVNNIEKGNQTKTVKGSTTYVVKQGDTLSLIARNKYGDGNYWYKIKDANKKVLSNPDGLKVGTVLVLPD